MNFYSGKGLRILEKTHHPASGNILVYNFFKSSPSTLSAKRMQI
jgi:hypothetical protein